jgi:hypothetical protein
MDNNNRGSSESEALDELENEIEAYSDTFMNEVTDDNTKYEVTSFFKRKVINMGYNIN